MTVTHRPRRLRQGYAMRELVAETRLLPANLMAPIFIREGLTSRQEISSMPGVYQYPLEELPAVLDEVHGSGVVSVMLFGIPSAKDSMGTGATDPEGILSQAVRVAKAHVGDRLVVVADLCLDEFTSHGHCGVLDAEGLVANDETLERYATMACVLGAAGVDMVATSGMMDGQVGFVRKALDQAGQHEVGIFAYAAKYASSFYGPFRDAVESELQGDRRAYQQDWRNRREATKEILLDIEEGCDIVMVKPALAYLDIISDAAALSTRPVAAYVVSGEYAMIELAAKHGLLNRDLAIDEALGAVRRAGATIICTYWAVEWAYRLKNAVGAK
jgi:porphobilinogen synthase